MSENIKLFFLTLGLFSSRNLLHDLFPCYDTSEYCDTGIVTNLQDINDNFSESRASE